MNLAEQILQSIRPRDDWWFPGLAAQLADRYWQEIGTPTFSRPDYDTERYLAMRGQLSPVAETTAPPPRSGLVTYLGARLSRHYKPIGIEAASAHDLPMEAATRRLNEALALIGQVPDLLASIQELVLAVHPLRTSCPDIDIGYSDPGVPFSIFVSILDTNDPIMRLRLAEGVVHEAMHLQLSLIEYLLPLVGSDQSSWHSPWRGEDRPTSGILHGTYVFAVVRDFVTRLIDLHVLDARSQAHAERRMQQINEEFAVVSWLPTSDTLTSGGRSLAAAILSSMQKTYRSALGFSASLSGSGFDAR